MYDTYGISEDTKGLMYAHAVLHGTLDEFSAEIQKSDEQLAEERKLKIKTLTHQVFCIKSVVKEGIKPNVKELVSTFTKRT